MIFLNFSQLPKKYFQLKIKKNIFLKTKLNFFFTEKCFFINFLIANKHKKI